MNFDKSNELLDKAEKIIPLATQTFSKASNYFPVGSSPLFLERGQGSHVWDIDGNEYVDFVCGLGPITLGYHYPVTDLAIKRQLKKGITFSQPSPLEYELAKQLTEIIPCAEMVRFLKTGSEACQAAIRIARAYSGKMGYSARFNIAYRGYHGWHDWYSVTTERSKGIPLSLGEYMQEFNYNKIQSLQNVFDKQNVAAVIMEPMIVEPPNDGFLQEVRTLCDKYKSLLIFDETVTGFRWDIGGAQRYFGVTPDIATFGKGMANGMPMAAVVGKKDIMREFEDVFVSSTFGGECLSLAASIATIKEMIKKETISHCWDMGSLLMMGLKELGMKVDGFPCRPILLMPNDQVWKSKLLEQLFLRGIMIHVGGFINICYSHSLEDINKTLNAFEDVLKIIDKVELQGKVAQPSFKRL